MPMMTGDTQAGQKRTHLSDGFNVPPSSPAFQTSPAASEIMGTHHTSQKIQEQEHAKYTLGRRYLSASDKSDEEFVTEELDDFEGSGNEDEVVDVEEVAEV